MAGILLKGSNMRLKQWATEDKGITIQSVEHGWFRISLAEYSDYSDSFIYQANHEELCRIIERNNLENRVRYKHGRCHSHWLELHHSIRCDELFDALDSLSDYPCLNDERLSELEFDHALACFDADEIAHSHIDSEHIATYPDSDTLFSFLPYWHSAPCEFTHPPLDLDDCLNAGMRLTVDYIRANILKLDRDTALLIAESHNHLSDEDMGIPRDSELGRLLMERASRRNPNQGKLF